MAAERPSCCFCWRDAARPAECCSGMDASGGWGLVVLARGCKETLPGQAGSRVGTTGRWASQSLGGGWAIIVERATMSSVSSFRCFCSPTPRWWLPHVWSLSHCPHPGSTTLYPPPPSLTHALVLTHPPMPGCTSVPWVCHLAHEWAGPLGPVQNNLVLDAREGNGVEAKIPGRRHPVVWCLSYETATASREARI